MTTSRQVRRARERAEKKRRRDVGQSPVKPTNEHGVEVDRDGERVLAAFYVGYATVTMSWARHDAEKVGEMLIEAARRELGKGKGEDVAPVGSSGLVIAHSLPDV